MRRVILFCCCLTAGLLSAQGLETRFPTVKKGNWYAFWGWNREAYSSSTIHFQGDQYNFVLSHVAAHDKPEPLGFSPYFHPTKITIPQTNARIGYFIKDRLSLSVGLDHMKYVMEQDQMVAISGHIAGTNSIYDGSYLHDFVYTSRNFLTFEHTDGLNYINAEVRHHTPILSLHKNKWLSFDLETMHGGGAGVLLPKTNCKLLGSERHDDFNLAGYGVHVMTGAAFTFWNHFVILPEFKGGFINLPNIRTTSSKSDRADQHFWFGAFDVLVGANFRIGKSTKRQ